MQPEWDVIKVTPHEDYTMTVEFYDGSIKNVDMTQTIKNIAVFAPLKEKKQFMSAKARYGTVVWSDKIDIAPEYLYENGIAAG